jgi:hypothetical protein
VGDAGIEQDALCRCRLSGVDVRHDSDVPATIQRYGASHGISSLRDFPLLIPVISGQFKDPNCLNFIASVITVH